MAMTSDRTLFLLDAMALAYRAYFAFISRPRISSRGIDTSCVYGFTTTLIRLIREHRLRWAAVVFDAGERTFRNDLYADYKAHRDPPPEQLINNLPLIRKVAEALSIPVFEVPGVEADDVIGTLARQADAEGDRAVIVSPDKDFQQLLSPRVSLFKPARRGEDFDVVTDDMFRKKFGLEPSSFIDMLALMGDKADNVPGIYGIGEKTAQKLIQQYDSVENLLMHAADVKGKRAREGLLGNPGMARLSKTLVTIKVDVPIKVDWDALRRGSLTSNPVLGLFRELEFRTLIRRLQQDSDPGLLPAITSTVRPDASVVDWRMIADVAELKALERTLREEKCLAFYALTDDKSPVHADWVGLAVAWAYDAACFIPLPLPDGTHSSDVVRILAPIFSNGKMTKIGHGIKPLIVRLGIEQLTLRGNVFDTEVAHYLLSPDASHSLGFVAREQLKYETVDMTALLGTGRSKRGLRDVPFDDLVTPACEAAALVFPLRDVLQSELKKQGLNELATDIEFPLILDLADMEASGVRIDLAALKVIESDLRSEVSRLEELIYAKAGERFNIGSPQQIGRILFEKLQLPSRVKTSSGKPSTKEDVLQDLATQHDLPGHILDWRRVTRLLSAYVLALPRAIWHESKRVHTVFNQTVAATGRLSSSDPGLQNIPVRTAKGREIRRAFVPRNGWRMLSADYAQIELRILAHMSQDVGLAEIFATGRDLHTETAARMFEIEPSDVTRAQRNRAKAVNYGIPYGLSATGLSRRLRCSRDAAKDLMRVYYESFPGIAPFLSRQVEIARECGYAKTLMGRRRYLPNITSRNPAVRSAAERIAFNMPIQGTQADMIKKAIVAICDAFRREGYASRLLLQVHDELVFEVPWFEENAVQDLVVNEMIEASSLSINVEVDAQYGLTWLDAH